MDKQNKYEFNWFSLEWAWWLFILVSFTQWGVDFWIVVTLIVLGIAWVVYLIKYLLKKSKTDKLNTYKSEYQNSKENSKYEHLNLLETDGKLWQCSSCWQKYIGYPYNCPNCGTTFRNSLEAYMSQIEKLK